MGEMLTNRDEENEHASMALKWIRHPVFSEESLVCLFTDKGISA